MKNVLFFTLLSVLFSLSTVANTVEIRDSSNHTSEWSISSPETKGVSATDLEKLHQEFENGDHGYINSFLVVKEGDIIFERYYDVDYIALTKLSKLEQAGIMQKNYGDLAIAQYNYHDPDWHPFYRNTKLHTIQSVTKSVTSALFGIAISRGEITDLDAKIVGYFPKYKSLFSDPIKQSITIRDLLTMTSGIKWDEFTHAYTDPSNDAASMESSDNWLKFILSLPMDMEPGQQFVYNSGITILLSHILQTSVSMPVDEYAQKHLFDPMGIQDFYWKKTPKGLTDAEGGLYLSTRDFAKIGLLYLNNGRWLDQQILPKEWVTATMTPATDTGFSGNHYGFQWWLAPYEGGKEKWMFSGSGYGGQYLLIIPEHNLVMVFNGWNIFDISRPTKEYLSSRVLKALAS